MQGASAIRSLVQQSANRICILAGGGVRADNAAALVVATGVVEVHSGARRAVHSSMTYRPPAAVALCGAAPSDWAWGATDAAAVRAVVVAVGGGGG